MATIVQGTPVGHELGFAIDQDATVYSITTRPKPAEKTCCCPPGGRMAGSWSRESQGGFDVGASYTLVSKLNRLVWSVAGWVGWGGWR